VVALRGFEPRSDG